MRARAACGVAGLAVLTVALSPIVDGQADVRLSAHMVQHLLLGVVAAPLIVVAAPIRLLLRRLPRSAARRLVRGLRHPIVRVLAHPACGVAAFALTLVVVHVPAVYETALRHPAAHALEHAALFWSAVWLWAPVVAADPLPHPPGAIGRATALIGAMVTMALVGTFLATAGHVVYPTYAHAAGVRDPLADQSLAGGLMWIGGMIVVVPALLVLAWRAMSEEERRARVRAASAHGARRAP